MLFYSGSYFPTVSDKRSKYKIEFVWYGLIDFWFKIYLDVTGHSLIINMNSHIYGMIIISDEKAKFIYLSNIVRSAIQMKTQLIF